MLILISPLQNLPQVPVYMQQPPVQLDKQVQHLIFEIPEEDPPSSIGK